MQRALRPRPARGTSRRPAWDEDWVAAAARRDRRARRRRHARRGRCLAAPSARRRGRGRRRVRDARPVGWRDRHALGRWPTCGSEGHRLVDIHRRRSGGASARRLSRDGVDEKNPARAGVWMGEAGILLRRRLQLAPDAARRERLLECVLANADNETLELMWGATGHDARRRRRCSTRTGRRTVGGGLAAVGQRRVLARLRIRSRALWTTAICTATSARSARPRTRVRRERRSPRSRRRAPPRGTPTRADAACDRRRSPLRARAGERTCQLAARSRGATRLSSTATGSGCSGVTARPGWSWALALLPAEPAARRAMPASRAAELTWDAGPLVKGPSLCHGTAGNGFALLALYRRTG